MDANSEKLRAKAKEELRQGKTIDTTLYETDMKVLVEELSIYQIELEQQNQELLQAQEHLQHSINRYLDLFDNAPIGYMIVDINGVIKDINQTAAKLLEGSKIEFEDTKITKFIHPDYQDIYYHYFQLLTNQKYHQPCDIKLRKGYNQFFYARIQGVCQPRKTDIEPEFRLALIDVSIQKEMEMKLLKAKQHAEESDRLKSAFLANMSHEIRTPMNGILGFAELLKEPELSGEKQQAYISIIEQSGARMLNIINDIIDISKIEAGLMNLKISDTNINDNIEYLYTFFKPEVEGKGMTLQYKTPLSAQEATIATDREKAYAILTNLVKNAIKYSNEGTIELGYELATGSAPALSISGKTMLQFYVKDTGLGIPKEKHKAIFERFIQADISNTKTYQGAGLGLAITKAYVEMLGGKIWVESEEGIGSTFYFTLPYQPVAIKTGITEKSGNANNTNEVRKLKVLIAEDDKISEMLLENTVKAFSNDILKARNGIEALEACRQHPEIDLVLMDIQMPEMTGYEATQKIREFNNDVVIIAQTANGLSADRDKAIEAGCNDYISKPIKKMELLTLVKKYFD